MIKVIVQYCNCEEWITKCLLSVAMQADCEYECIIMDDCSTDNSLMLVADATRDMPNVRVIKHSEKHWQARNYYEMAHNYCDDEDIIVTLDGDDWFPDKFVLKNVEEIYRKNKHLWITWGQFVCSSGKPGWCSNIEDWPYLRKGPWVTSHLRTFKAWLFKKIKEKDLKYYGEWTRCTGDKFVLYPMLEMAGPEHSKFIDKAMYVYNDINPLNEHKVRYQEQMSAEVYVRNLPPYERIEK